jgi:hypothetical protein
LLGDEDDSDKLYWSIQTANDIATNALEQAGYDAGLLKATILKKKEKGGNERMMVPNSIAQQQALVNAHGHGGQFMVTGGMHTTSDNMFIAIEMAAHQRDKVEAEKDKKLCLQLQEVEEKGMAIWRKVRLLIC